VTAWQNVDGKWIEADEGKGAGEKAPSESRVVGAWAELDQRLGGGLLIFGDAKSVDLSEATLAAPTSLTVLREAKKTGAHVVARGRFAWDLRVWLASGELDGIQVIHQHALRNGVVDDEKDGRPRDTTLFPGRAGNGRWSEMIYEGVLECGFRVPPVAGSG